MQTRIILYTVGHNAVCIICGKEIINSRNVKIHDFLQANDYCSHVIT